MALFQTNAGPPKPSYEISISVTCTSDVSVGDFVYQSPSVDELFLPAINNTEVPSIVGLVIAKGSDTDCKVLLLGVAGGFSGLVRSKLVFLGEDGRATTTRPTSGYVQILGEAISSNKAIINPQLNKVKLI